MTMAYIQSTAMRKEPSALDRLASACVQMGADIRYRPEDCYFTALAQNEWEAGALERALTLQREIQRKAALYPEIKCYCFDPFSTLIYKI